MSQPQDRRPRSPFATAAIVAVATVILQALLVPLFAAPAANLAPRDLPVVVAGPDQAAEGVVRRLQADDPKAFDITVMPDAAAADQKLRDREAYAAIVVTPGGAELHTATAASPIVAALLTQASTQLGDGQQVRVVDVVPGDPDDPRGSGFAAGFLPLLLTSMVAGILFSLLVRSRWGQLAGLLTYGILAGLVGAAVLQQWLGVIPGDYLTNAAAIALLATAAAATLAGLAALLGRAGIALGALLVFLLGNPLSAVTAAPELLPRPWGEVGQWLPAGAGGSLLRSTAFFDGAGATRPLWILAGYAVVGLLLVAVGRVSPAAATAAAHRTPAAAAARQ
ncbi:MAG TPA: hypothetical protein VHN18_02180 [Micromonosporaceae bacterium]|nr:hypothetical protein [Micromonosporaceae bacterium]